MTCRVCATNCRNAGSDYEAEACQRFTKKKFTNADRLRSMRDDELARYLYVVSDNSSIEAWLGWLTLETDRK